MRIPKYALDGLGANDATPAKQAIRLTLIGKLMTALEDAGLSKDGTIRMKLPKAEAIPESAGPLSYIITDMVNQIRQEQMRRSDAAKVGLNRAQYELDSAVGSAKAARDNALRAAQQGDKAGFAKAAADMVVEGGKAQVALKAQKVIAKEVVAPQMSAADIIEILAPSLDKASDVLLENIKAGVEAKKEPELSVNTEPFSVRLPRTRSPFSSLVYPDGGMGQFRRIGIHEMDIGSYSATNPPFSEHDFGVPGTESAWADQFDSEEVADMFDDGMGDASEFTESDDWSPPNDTFPGWSENEWPFDQNVVGIQAPTEGNVAKMIRGGIKAAMRTIDQTESIDEMNRALAELGISPKPAGQPFTTAGNVTYDRIIEGLASEGLISAQGNRPVAIKMLPQTYRKFVDAGFREERKLRAERRKFTKWMGR